MHKHSFFNQPIHQMELESTQLTTLNFGKRFNHPLGSLFGRSYLPPTLCHLTVGPFFNQSLKSIPQSVYHLTIFYYGTVEEINIIVPSTVRRLNKREL